MITDHELMFSKDQAVTATALSTNVYDSAPLGPNSTVDWGDGEPIYLVVQCDEDATAAGAATVTVTLESDDAPTMDDDPVVHFTSGPVGLDEMTSGSRFVVIALPRGDYKRYLAVRYTVATGPLTAGEFSAFIVKDVGSLRVYADNSPIEG